jgi:hypothetical protein
MKTPRRILTIAALLATATGLASANSISFSASYGLNGSDNPTQATNWGTSVTPTFPFVPDGSETLSITGFNSALGSLSSVQLSVEAFASTAVDATAGSAGASIQEFTVDVGAAAATPSGQVIGTTSNGNGAITTVDVFNITLTPGETLSQFNGGSPYTGAGSQSFGPTTVNDPGDFIGSTVTLDIGAFASTVISSTSGNVTTANNTDAGELVTVTYNFTPASTTPEPTTMVLMGGALVGIGLIGKKRFKKS